MTVRLLLDRFMRMQTKGQEKTLNKDTDELLTINEDRHEIGPIGQVVDQQVHSDFNEYWYLARYPDVAKAGAAAWEHYVKYGKAEGRAPNAASEKKENWLGRFDEMWYLSRYPDVAAADVDPLSHFIYHGLLEGRFCNRQEADLALWANSFDAAWYLEKYADVRQSGVDPLGHFIGQGILEDRRPNASEMSVGEPAAKAHIECYLSTRVSSETALFVTHSADGRLKPHVMSSLRHFRAAAIDVVLIIASDSLSVDLTSEIKDLARNIYVRDNRGFDFAAWAHVILLRPDLLEVDSLILVNDSCFGPLNQHDFDDLLSRIRQDQSAVIGLTENVDRGWHLQSYFLVIRRNALKSSAFQDFLRSIVSYASKNDVVNEYETRLASVLLQAGFDYSVMFPTPGASNPTLYNWKQLIVEGFPFLKVATARDVLSPDVAFEWRSLCSSRGYDTTLADSSLRDYWNEISKREKDAVKSCYYRLRAAFHEFMLSENIFRIPDQNEPALTIVLLTAGNCFDDFVSLSSLSAIERSYELVIVESPSTEGYNPILHRLVGGVTRLSTVEGISELVAMNLAACQASGYALFFLASGNTIENEGISDALELLAADPKRSAVIGRSLSSQFSIMEAVGSSSAIYNNSILRDLDALSRGDLQALSTLIVNTTHFHAIGRLNTQYEHKELAIADLCLKLIEAGAQISSSPSLKLTIFCEHKKPWSSKHTDIVHLRQRFPRHIAASPEGLPRSVDDVLLVSVSSFPSKSRKLDRATSGLAASIQRSGFNVIVETDPARMAEIDVSCYRAIVSYGAKALDLMRSAFWREPHRACDVKFLYVPESIQANADFAWMSAEIPLNGFRLRSSLCGAELARARFADVTVVSDIRDAAFLSIESIFKFEALPSSLFVNKSVPASDRPTSILLIDRLGLEPQSGEDELFLFCTKSVSDFADAFGFVPKIHYLGVAVGSRKNLLLEHEIDVHSFSDDVEQLLSTVSLAILLTKATDFPSVQIARECALLGIPTFVDVASAPIFGAIYRPNIFFFQGVEGAAQLIVSLFGNNEKGSREGYLSPAADLRLENEESESEFWHRMLNQSSKLLLPLRRSLDGSYLTKRTQGGKRTAVTEENYDGHHSKAFYSSDVAVVYLARCLDDHSHASIYRFVSSYKRNRSGIGHRLYVVIKGHRSKSESGAVRSLFSEISNAEFLELPDEGFDIQAYISSLKSISSEYLCFLNTSSEILAPDWLSFFTHHILRPEVGLVGATGSFETHETFGSGKGLPNVHLRSNAFMIDRETLISYSRGLVVNTKEDAYGFENGPTSLTSHVCGRGRAVLIVGRNGRGYPPIWWPASDTFRQGKQSNLLVADNQTRLFDEASLSTKEYLMERAWKHKIKLGDFPFAS